MLEDSRPPGTFTTGHKKGLGMNAGFFIVIAVIAVIVPAWIIYALNRKISQLSQIAGEFTPEDASFSGKIRITTERGESLSVTNAIRQIQDFKRLDVCNVSNFEVIVDKTFANKDALMRFLILIQSIDGVITIQTGAIRPRFNWNRNQRNASDAKT